MAVVLLVAIDCAVSRGLNSFPLVSRPLGEILDLALCGLLPMANVLAIVALLRTAARSARRRAFLTGFLKAGAMAWSVALILACVAHAPIHEAVDMALTPLKGVPLAFLPAAAAVLWAPQALWANLGGWVAARRSSQEKDIICF